MELFKLMINSVLSRRGAQLKVMNISNFYLYTPMKKTDYVKIQSSKIPQEFVDEYILTAFVHNGWVYF